MTLPLTSPFTANTVVTKAQLDQLVGSINAGAFGYLDSGTSIGTVTLATVGADVAGLGVATFTLATQRRVLLLAMARYSLGSSPTAGRMTVQVGYNSGSSSSIGSVTKVGTSGHVYNNSGVTGINGSSSAYGFAAVLLAAGTWAAYPVVTRQNGGSNDDVASSFATYALDVGSA